MASSKKNVSKIKKVRKFSSGKYIAAIGIAAVLVVLFVIGAIHFSGVRYVKYDIDGEIIKFLGKVDKNGDFVSGTVYYFDGTRAEYSYDSETAKSTLKYSTGDKYVGEVDKFLRNGKGYIEFADTSIYSGDFIYGKMSGKGTFYYAGGDIYEGDFLDGIKHGSGTYTWPLNAERKVDSYVGEYHNGLRHGKGTYTWADGSVYEGD